MPSPKIEITTSNAILKKACIKKALLITKGISSFFPKSPKLIIVHIFDNREQFLKSIKKKNAPSWLVASVPPQSTSLIFLLNEHGELSKNTAQILIHEIAHLYTNANNPDLPTCIKEGISVFLAKQIFAKSIKKQDWEKIVTNGIPFKKIQWQSAAKHNGYSAAGLLVSFLIKKCGKKNFLNAIWSYDQKVSLFKTFASISKHSPDSLLKDFSKSFVK